MEGFEHECEKEEETGVHVMDWQDEGERSHAAKENREELRPAEKGVESIKFVNDLRKI